MTRKEFFNAALAFDWYYEMSDDHRVWQCGHERRRELLSEAKDDPVKESIWEAWAGHKYSGKPWGTEQRPRPVPSDFDLEIT